MRVSIMKSLFVPIVWLKLNIEPNEWMNVLLTKKRQSCEGNE